MALFDTTDLAGVHRIVYANSLTPHLRGTDVDDGQAKLMRKRSVDPYYSAAYLPYFSVKPLYVLAMESAHRGGFSVVDSSRFVSAVFYFCIAVITWVYTRSLLSAVILLFPEILILGQANEPDGMSVCFITLGLWLVFIRNCDLGILPLVVSVWIRPDNFLACTVVLGLLHGSRRIKFIYCVALGMLALGSAIFISHFGYGWRSLYWHTFLGGEPTAFPHFGIMDYVHALWRGFNDLLHSTVPLFGLLWLLCFAMSEKPSRQILSVSLLYSALRFLIYPSYEARYYGVFFLMTSLSAVLWISTSPFYKGILNRGAPRAGALDAL